MRTVHRVHAVVSASALIITPVGVALSATPATAATTKRVAGPTVSMHWGDVRVVLTMRGKKIVDVAAAAPTERPRSAFINQHAIPFLRTEVLRAQSARISALSGATDTSLAYEQSLAAAIRKARA